MDIHACRLNKVGAFILKTKYDHKLSLANTLLHISSLAHVSPSHINTN